MTLFFAIFSQIGIAQPKQNNSRRPQSLKQLKTSLRNSPNYDPTLNEMMMGNGNGNNGNGNGNQGTGNGNGNQGTGNGNGNGPAVPIDKDILILLLAGCGLGLYQLNKQNGWHSVTSIFNR